MKKEASVALKEIEEHKRYTILARAVMLALKEIGVDCHVDIKSEGDRLNISVEG